MHPLLDRIWKQSIVCVEEYDVLASATAKASIAGGGQPAIALMEVMNPRKGSGHLGSFVGGSVINDQNLDELVSLGERALDRFPKILRLVLANHDNRDYRMLMTGEAVQQEGMKQGAFHKSSGS